MMLAIDNLPHELLLGRQTENGVTVISIDVQSWLDQWPGMETVIMATRPGESAAYPAATHMDGSCIVWTVNGADTAIAGRGTAEILGLVDGVRKLSQIVRTRIKASTVAATMEPPDGAQPWVDKVINAADEIKNMTAQAETLKPGDAATASYADGKLTLGIPRGLPGAKGDKGDPGPKGAPGSDANVTAENIQSALGYMPVNPTALDAKQNVLNDADRQSITKTGMTTGAAWTSAEQKAARERIGMDDNYVLIEETVLTEGTVQFERAQEPDGTPYNFSAIKLVVKFVPGQTNGAFFLFGKNNGVRIVGGASQTLSMPSLTGNANFRSTAVFNAKPGYGGVYDCDVAIGSQGSAMAVTRSSGGAYIMTKTEKKIQSIDFYLYLNDTVPIIAGTEIAIYGVRA